MAKEKFKREYLGIPYVLFMFLFVVLPMVILFFYAFTDGQGQISFANFLAFFQDRRTVGTLIYSLGIALVTTLLCLLLAYPLAYILVYGGFRRRNVLLLLFIMPMWINFTLRMTALKELLSMLEQNLAFYPEFNTIIGMSYDFLPFMILPIYNALAKIDISYREAAMDLGAKPWSILLHVMIPLSMPGVISGINMVFLPAMTNYVVLDMLYNSTFIMGSLIGSYFSIYDWNNGSLIAVILLFLVFIITFLSGEFSDVTENGGFL